MQYTALGNLRLSRLGLGTVQFGLEYGLNNRSGQVSMPDIVHILEQALEGGINFLDTSRVYGASEANLGKAFRELGVAEHFIVCTKLDLPKGYQTFTETELLGATKDCLDASMDALGLDVIPFYLVHDPAYLDVKGGVVWAYLKERKKNGDISHLGVSMVNGPEEALASMDHPEVEMIQIPYNVLDGRWSRAGVFEKAKRVGAAIVTRSAYLQGLLGMESTDVASKLPFALPWSELYERTARRIGVPKVELALRYVLSNSAIAVTITGVDSPVHLQENLRIYRMEAFSDTELGELRSVFADVPVKIVNPALWSHQT